MNQETTRIAYRFFDERDGKIMSHNGDQTWPMPNGEPGGWVVHEGPIKLCSSGLHASPTIQHALEERQGWRFGRVECSEIETESHSKFACRQMRILTLYSREHVVSLAVIAGALSLKHFEKDYPVDRRPREAILATIEWVKTGKDNAAAYAANANAANAAYAAAYAAYAANAANAAAAYAANAAAYAANAAAYAANAAAYAANAAANAAAYAANAAANAANAANAAFWQEFNVLAQQLLDLPREALADWLTSLLGVPVGQGGEG